MSNSFNQPKVLKQMKSNGIMETVKLRKAGYSTKVVFDTFISRYGMTIFETYTT